MELPDYNPNFPQHRPRDLAEVVSGLDPLGVDLLAVCPPLAFFVVWVQPTGSVARLSLIHI